MRSSFLFFSVLVFLQISFSIEQTVMPIQFPLYKQCDPRWGSNLMETSVICQEGCAMSSLSMGLNGFGILIGGTQSNPGTLNAWLRANQGYVCAGGDCNNLVINSPSRLATNITTIGENPKPTVAQMQQMLSTGYVMLAHVQNNHHFVLVTGYDVGNNVDFYVNDPYYPYITYPYQNISDCIVYQINGKQPKL